MLPLNLVNQPINSSEGLIIKVKQRANMILILDCNSCHDSGERSSESKLTKESLLKSHVNKLSFRLHSTGGFLLLIHSNTFKGRMKTKKNKKIQDVLIVLKLSLLPPKEGGKSSRSASEIVYRGKQNTKKYKSLAITTHVHYNAISANTEKIFLGQADYCTKTKDFM